MMVFSSIKFWVDLRTKVNYVLEMKDKKVQLVTQVSV